MLLLRGQDAAGKHQGASGLLLSDDVPDAGVQEHVLVLRKRKSVLRSGLQQFALLLCN